MKKEKDEEKKGIAESFLEGIPFLGNLVKELGKTEVFQERFKEINEKIEENLRKGEKRYVSVEGNISIRPLALRPISRRSIIDEIKNEIPEAELEVGKDYAYGKKADKLIFTAKVPDENVDTSVKGRTLYVKGTDFQKKFRLPDFYKEVTKRQYKNGILTLELTK